MPKRFQQNYSGSIFLQLLKVMATAFQHDTRLVVTVEANRVPTAAPQKIDPVPKGSCKKSIQEPNKRH